MNPLLMSTLGIHLLSHTYKGRTFWSFAGSGIPAVLAYSTKDGKVPSESQFKAAAHCGPGIAGIKTRTWDTKEDAERSMEWYMVGMGFCPVCKDHDCQHVGGKKSCTEEAA